MDNEMKEKIIQIADKYGYDAQSRQCIEEMAELTQAVNKFWRKQLECGIVSLEKAEFRNKEYENLVEEIADVKIMIAQMEYFMDCEEEVFEIMRKKLDRQMERIQAEREEFERRFKEAVTA